MRLMISPKIPTSSGAPVMPMTPASFPAMTMGRLMPACTPWAGSSCQTVFCRRPWAMSCEAPWCSWPQREGLVLAMMMPWQFMMFISRWMERFISSTMCWAC